MPFLVLFIGLLFLKSEVIKLPTVGVSHAIKLLTYFRITAAFLLTSKSFV